MVKSKSAAFSIAPSVLMTFSRLVSPVKQGLGDIITDSTAFNLPRVWANASTLSMLFSPTFKLVKCFKVRTPHPLNFAAVSLFFDKFSEVKFLNSARSTSSKPWLEMSNDRKALGEWPSRARFRTTRKRNNSFSFPNPASLQEAKISDTSMTFSSR